MKRNPKVGETGELTFTVANEHAIHFSDDQMPLVLSSPWLIWFLENSARNALMPLLDEGERCVGTHVDVEHVAPTPLGHRVTCRSRVIHVDGSIISFQVEAHDEHELIAKGLHKRAVIVCSRFKSRVEKKAALSGDQPG